MVTGASTANLAIILIDARKGVIEQTRRHSIIASLLQIKHIIVCVNKMDLVEFGQETFEQIKADYLVFAKSLSVPDIKFIPISALLGDNVVDPSSNTPWYSGETLLKTLETVNLEKDHNINDGRFPVQYVIRPHTTEFHDYRGYAGRVEGGVFKPGDEVIALPSTIKTKIKSIDTLNGPLSEALPTMSVTITLEDNIDISRGDMLVKADSVPTIGQEIQLMVCWLADKKLQPGGKYIIRHTTKETKCIVKEVPYKLNISTSEKIEDDKEVGLNDIAHITIKTASPLFYDSYSKNRSIGSLILIDEFSNETVGAGMII